VSKPQHPCADEVLWYVRDGLRMALQGWPSPRLQAFEEHAASCDPCAARVAAQASDELLMQEVALEEFAERRRAPSVLAYLVGAAATLLLVVGVSGASSASASHGSAETFVAPLDAGLNIADSDFAIAALEH
jgi:hypothetical protein